MSSAVTVEQTAEVFIREIEQGIEETGIKAGAIKAAFQSASVLPAELKGFKAAARGSKATGVPIETHTDPRHSDVFQRKREVLN